MTDEPTALARVETIHRMLTEAKTLPAVRQGLAVAEALADMVKGQHLGTEAANMAMEEVLRFKRKGGELLKEMPSNPGGQAEHQSYQSHDATSKERPPTLSEVGLTKRQSSDWKRIADIPPDRFEEHIEETKAAGEELTTAGVLRIAEREPVIDATARLAQRRVVDIAKSDELLETAARVVGMDAWDFARRNADAMLVAIGYADVLIRAAPMTVVRDIEHGAGDVAAATEKLRIFAERAAIWAPAVLRELNGSDQPPIRLMTGGE